MTTSSPTTTIVCVECNAPFDLEFPSLARYVDTCPACCEREIAAETREILAAAALMKKLRPTDWTKICPAAFQLTEPYKLPRPTLLEKVLRWTYGPRGLLLHGETGLGKTRCAWLLLKRESEAGRTVAAVDVLGLSHHFPALFAQSCAAADAWVRRLCAADILLLDDPFKAKLTERTEETLFAIVDKRLSEGLPIILTANDTGDTLTARLSQDRGAPLIRRLRDGCEDVAFVQ